MNEIDCKITSRERIPQLLRESLELDKNITVTFVNPYSYYLLSVRLDLLENIDYIFVDGLLLESLHNLFQKKRIKRASFDLSSIAKEVFEYCIKYNLKVAIIGATKDENSKATENLKELFPLLYICSSRNGYFSGSELCNYLLKIKSLNPDLLVVGAGTPFQEEIICTAKKMKLGRILFTCGGFLTQTSIKTEYYHPLITKFDLRWLQRAFFHKHVRMRLAIDYPRFLLRYISENLFSKLRTFPR